MRTSSMSHYDNEKLPLSSLLDGHKFKMITENNKKRKNAKKYLN